MAVTVDEEVIIQFKADMAKFKSDMKKIESTTKKTSQNVVSSLKKGFATIGSLLVVKDSISSLIKIGDAYTTINNKIKLVSDTTKEYNTAQKELFKLSQDTYTELDATVSLYSKLSIATEALGTSQQDLFDIVTVVNQSLVVSGASAQEASSVVKQLGQGLASGVLRGDEFNSIMENGSRIATALADSLGVTTGELRQMAEDGELTSEVVTTALKGQAKIIGEEFKGMNITVDQSITSLGNSYDKIVSKINTHLGVTDKLSVAVRSLSSFMDNNSQAIMRSLSTIKQLGIVMLEVVVAYKAAHLAQRTFIAYQSGIGLAGFVKTTIEVGKFGRQLVAARIAQTALNTAMKLTPWGLAIAGTVALLEVTRKLYNMEKNRQSLISGWIEGAPARATAKALTDYQSLGKELNSNILASKNLAEGMTKFGKSTTQYIAMDNALTNLVTRQVELENEISKGALSFEKAIVPIKKVKEEIVELSDLKTPDIKMPKIKMPKIKMESAEAVEAIKDISDELKASQHEADRLATTMSDGLGQWVQGAMSFGDAMENVLRGILAQFVELSVSNPFKNLLSGLFGGTGETAPTFDFMSMLSGAFADGGTAYSGGNYLVGERGAEIVNLPAGASVTPNHQLGGGGVVVNVNNYGNDKVDVRQRGNEIDIIVAKISSDVSRGVGALGGAFESRYGLSKK